MEDIRQRHPENFYFLMKTKNSIARFFIWIAVIVCIYFVGKATTCFINWIFFVLNIVCFAIILKSDGKPATLKNSMNEASDIKTYSAVILVFEICFICFIGE